MRRLISCCALLCMLAGACSSAHRRAAPAQPLAFAALDGAAADLWTVREDGSSLRRLTSTPGTELEPAWSPDRAEIAFVGSDGTDDPNGAVRVLTLSTKRVRTLTPPDVQDAAMPTWSPDGKQIAYVRAVGTWTQIFVVNADGTGTRQVTHDAAGHDWPSWSPDRKHLAYTRSTSTIDSTLWVVRADGTGAHGVQPWGFRTAYEESWSPDGRSIAFVAPAGDLDSADPVDWNEEVYVLNLRDRSVRRLTHAAGNDHWPPAWSPDGRRLVYTSDGRSGIPRLMIVDADGSHRTALPTQHLGAVAFPAW